MAIGRAKTELVLSAEEHAQVSALASSRSRPHAMVARAKLVLWAAQGESNSAIAERLGGSMPTVGKWRRRFVEQRVSGLHDELRSGRPRTYRDEQVAGLINRVLRSRPKHATLDLTSLVDGVGENGRRRTAMPGTHPPYAPEYRRRIIELARAGRRIEELAREFEPSANAIRQWVKQAELDEGLRSDGLTTSEREELNRLRRENRVLREEREILSKAAAWFGQETNATPGRRSHS